MSRKPDGPLRRGWTTGACATAATKAALTALMTGTFPDPVSITLPKGETPAFPLAREGIGEGWAMAGIVKDAGDDPDVTHGATVIATIRHGVPGSGVVFKAGEGVGTVTKPGLPLPVGEPAINPVPRRMMTEVVEALVKAPVGSVDKAPAGSADIEIEISIPDGEALAAKTWNPRLGIVGGLSILGTTGVVHPFSCSAWIHSIHRGIDVAGATGLKHVAACTGSTSEAAVAGLHDLPEIAFLDMGDFAGGLLKYLRAHPLPKLTLAGGFGKFTKLAQGHLDLHSGRSQVDFEWLADRIAELGGDAALVAATREANTANEVLTKALEAGLPLADRVARGAAETARGVLDAAPVSLEVLVIDRAGRILANVQDPAPETGPSK
jgi:cobalt-precorrin-5B (C1)-methyltransferase